MVLQLLEHGIESLNAEQQDCIKMFYIGEMSSKEIAASTGFSMNEVKSHIQNGKRNLKNYLTKQ